MKTKKRWTERYATVTDTGTDSRADCLSVGDRIPLRDAHRLGTSYGGHGISYEPGPHEVLWEAENGPDGIDPETAKIVDESNWGSRHISRPA